MSHHSDAELSHLDITTEAGLDPRETYKGDDWRDNSEDFEPTPQPTPTLCMLCRGGGVLPVYQGHDTAGLGFDSGWKLEWEQCSHCKGKGVV